MSMVTPGDNNATMAPFGWHTQKAAVIVSYLILVPTVLVSALLVFSFYLTIFGLVLLPAALAAMWALYKRRVAGAPHPAIFMAVLAAIEIMLPIAAITVLTVGFSVEMGDWWRLAPTLAPGAVTLCAALLIRAASQAADAHHDVRLDQMSL